MRALRLLEFFEYFGLVGFGYARSGILDCDRVTAIGRRSLHRHLAAVGEFDRIANQVEQYLRKAPFVAARGRQIRRYFELEVQFLVARQRLDRDIDALHHVLDRIIIERKHKLPGLDLGKIKNVVDQAEQVLAVGLDALKHVAHLLRRIAVNAVKDELGIAEDRVERRAQFVAHIGEELRFVFARLFDLPAFFLNFLEQADVLDGDHGLVGKRRHQFDLLLGERPHLASHQCDDAGRRTFAQHRHTQQRADIGSLNKFGLVVGIYRHIGDLNRRTFHYRSAYNRRPAAGNWVLGDILFEFRWESVHSNRAVTVLLRAIYRSHVGITQPGGRFDEGIQHRLQIEGRAADDFQHLRRGGLLFKRLAEFARALLLRLEQPNVLDRNCRLIGKGRQQRDVLLLEWPHFGAANQDVAERAALTNQRHREGRVMAEPSR